MVSFDPEAVMICCSFVPENWPSTADVIEEGGWIVKLYMNMELVVAMLGNARPSPASLVWDYWYFVGCKITVTLSVRCR